MTGFAKPCNILFTNQQFNCLKIDLCIKQMRASDATIKVSSHHVNLKKQKKYK